MMNKPKKRPAYNYAKFTQMRKLEVALEQQNEFIPLGRPKKEAMILAEQSYISQIQKLDRRRTFLVKEREKIDKELEENARIRNDLNEKYLQEQNRIGQRKERPADARTALAPNDEREIIVVPALSPSDESRAEASVCAGLSSLYSFFGSENPRDIQWHQVIQHGKMLFDTCEASATLDDVWSLLEENDWCGTLVRGAVYKGSLEALDTAMEQFTQRARCGAIFTLVSFGYSFALFYSGSEIWLFDAHERMLPAASVGQTASIDAPSIKSLAFVFVFRSAKQACDYIHKAFSLDESFHMTIFVEA